MNISMDIPISDPPLYESPITRITTFATSLSMCLCCLVGLFGNTISAIIFLHPLMVSPINVLLAGLSLIDLLLILLSIVVLIVPSLNLLVQNTGLSNVYGFTTVFLYPLCTTMHSSSIWTFVLVSIERYNATCKPLKPHKLLTCRQARLAQTFVVVVALCYNSIRFWEYKETQRNETRKNTVEPYLRTRLDYFISYYTVLYIITHFILPFSVILILNTFIIRSIHCTDRYLHRRGAITGAAYQSRHAKQQRKTTNMIVVITSLFALCNVFPFMLNIWEALYPALFYGPWKSIAYAALDISNTLVLFNSSITFIVYLSYCRRYRVIFEYLVKRYCRTRIRIPDPASDPCFRRYSVVNNSVYESGLDMTMLAYTRCARGYNNGRPSSVDTCIIRLSDPPARRQRRSAAGCDNSHQMRSRVYTQ